MWVPHTNNRILLESLKATMEYWWNPSYQQWNIAGVPQTNERIFSRSGQSQGLLYKSVLSVNDPLWKYLNGAATSKRLEMVLSVIKYTKLGNFRRFLISNGIKIALLVQELRHFSWMGGFSLIYLNFILFYLQKGLITHVKSRIYTAGQSLLLWRAVKRARAQTCHWNSKTNYFDLGYWDIEFCLHVAIILSKVLRCRLNPILDKGFSVCLFFHLFVFPSLSE